MSEMLKEIMKDEFVRQRQDQEKETKIQCIRDVMEKLAYTPDQAMDLFNIPQTQRPTYAALV